MQSPGSKVYSDAFAVPSARKSKPQAILRKCSAIKLSSSLGGSLSECLARAWNICSTASVAIATYRSFGVYRLSTIGLCRSCSPTIMFSTQFACTMAVWQRVPAPFAADTVPLIVFFPWSRKHAPSAQRGGWRERLHIPTEGGFVIYEGHCP